MFLREHVEEEDVIVFGDIAWRGTFAVASTVPATVRTVHFVGTHYFIDEVESSLAVAAPALEEAPRVWFIDNQQPHDPGRLTAQALIIERILDVLPMTRMATLETDFSPVRIYRFGPGPVPTSRAIEALFGDAYLLDAATLPAEAAAGGTVGLLLDWQALGTLARPYAVFVHLRDATGRTVAQGDNEPRLGTRPTITWRRGERVRDPHIIAVPPDLAVGAYRVVVGLYDDLGRLPVASGGDEVLIGLIRIRSNE